MLLTEGTFPWISFPSVIALLIYVFFQVTARKEKERNGSVIINLLHGKNTFLLSSENMAFQFHGKMLSRFNERQVAAKINNFSKWGPGAEKLTLECSCNFQSVLLSTQHPIKQNYT